MSPDDGPLRCINAITLLTTDMGSSLRFYETLGFQRRYGDADSEFASLHVGDGFLNLQLGEPPNALCGRVIVWVDDVDAMHRRAVDAGYRAESNPADAPWGERYFHIRDPSGHELSFAKLL